MYAAKIIARILLCAAAVVIVVCGLIFYRYVDDRQANGTYTTSYFDSNGFSREYNDAVERLLEALQAIEAEGNITTERAANLPPVLWELIQIFPTISWMKQEM